MTLDAVKSIGNFILPEQSESAFEQTSFDKWLNFPISKIAHHGSACCEAAREWLIAMDFSLLNAASIYSGPRWIAQRFPWGPTKWPIYWCEALKLKTLDCGVQAVLAREVFNARGVYSYQIQLVQQYSHDTTRQWRERWNLGDASTFWLDRDFIYHECCAVLTGDDTKELKIFDSSAGSWVHPKQPQGYGAVRALRLVDESKKLADVNWGDNVITPNKWIEIY